MDNTATKNFEHLKLPFKTIASAISDCITKHDSSDSLLININGEAGSGKSSVINGILDILDSYYLIGKSQSFTLDSIRSSKIYVSIIRILEGLGIFFVMLNCLILSLTVINFNFWDFFSNTTLFTIINSIPGVVLIKKVVPVVIAPPIWDDLVTFIKLIISVYITFLVIFTLINYLIVYKLFSFIIDNVFIKPALYISEVFRKENSIKEKKKPVVISFDLWNYPESNLFFEDYLYLLSLKLASDKSNTDFKTCSSLINKYAAQMKGKITNQIKRKTSRIVPFLSEDSVKLKNKISQIFSRSQKKFIIVFDNFEKLNSEQIILNLQLIKSIANFPNFIFIVSTDYSKFKLMKTNQHDDLYVDELVKQSSDIYFEMPSIDKAELKNLLLNNIDRLINYYSIPEESFNLRYFEFIYDIALKNLFKTYRDVDRYINSVVRMLNIIKKDVYITEYLAIAAIQLYQNNVYQFIKKNKELLLNQMYDGQDSNYKLFDLYQGTLKDFFNEDNPVYNFEMKLLIMCLFPKIIPYFEADEKFLPEYLKDLRKDELYRSLSISNPDNFDTYFKLVLAVPGTFSCFDLNCIIKNYIDDKQSINRFLKYLPPKAINDLLLLLIDFENHYATRHLAYDDILNIIAIVLDYLEQADDIKIDNKTLLASISKILSSSKYSTRYNSVKTIIEKSQSGLYHLIMLVDNLEKIIITPTKTQIEALNDMLYRKFEDLDKTMLFNNNRLLSILSYFYQIGFQSDINIFAYEMLTESDNQKITKVLLTYCPERFENSIFDDTELLKEKLLQLKESDYYINLDEQDKEKIQQLETILNITS